MEGIANEQAPAPRPDFSTPAELERAKKGVDDFKKTFQSNWLGGRKILRSGRIAPAVQSMFLGLKPMAGFIGREMEEVRKVKLPDRFKLEQGHLYDRELVKEVISKNPDVFKDFPEEGDVDTYMQALLSRKPHTNQTAEDIVRVGLLYGFPKDSVLSYASRIKDYVKIINAFINMAPSIVNDPRWRLSDLEKEIILHIAHVDKGGKAHLEPGYLENFLDQHSGEVRAFLERHHTKEEVDFLVENRPEDVHGFQYGTGVPTLETLNFPKKVNELYAKSGMDQLLSRSRFLVYW